MNELVSVSQNVTVEILESTERGLHGLYGLHGLHILHGLHGLQSAFYQDISCDLAHSIKAFSETIHIHNVNTARNRPCS